LKYFLPIQKGQQLAKQQHVHSPGLSLHRVLPRQARRVQGRQPKGKYGPNARGSLEKYERERENGVCQPA